MSKKNNYQEFIKEELRLSSQVYYDLDEPEKGLYDSHAKLTTLRINKISDFLPESFLQEEDMESSGAELSYGDE